MILNRLGLWMFWIIEVCGALITAAGLVLLYVSCLAWLKFGSWPATDVQMFWDNLHTQWPQVSWASVQMVYDRVPIFVRELPLWAGFLGLGAGFYIPALLGVRILDEASWVSKKRT
jgi:hypothetical protein